MTLFCTKGKLLDAAWQGDVKAVKDHLHSRFFKESWLSHRDEYNFSGLMWAARHGNTEIVKLLLNAGADANSVTKDNRSLITLAVSSGCVETIDALVEAKVDINLADKNGDTPLHSAVMTENIKVVECLLRHGAKADLRNKAGKTALDLAHTPSGVETWLEVGFAYKKLPIANLLEKHLGLELTKSPDQKKKEKKQETPKQQATESWIKMGDDKIAHIGIYPEIDEKITEVFNFTTRERRAKSENLASKAESLAPAESFDILDENILRTAFDAFTKQRGVADEDFVFRGVRPLENKLLSRK